MTREDLVTRLSLQPDAWNGLCLQAADEIVKQRAEIDRLQAIVSRLPTTADGVPMVPGDSVYVATTGYERRVRAVFADSVAVTIGLIAATIVNIHPHQCYSTREAAEKARADNGNP